MFMAFNQPIINHTILYKIDVKDPFSFNETTVLSKFGLTNPK